MRASLELPKEDRIAIWNQVTITLDAHKWLSVPVAAGMFLTRWTEMLEPTFAVDAGYMPKAAAGSAVVEPHRSSMQWTRRFTGFKLCSSRGGAAMRRPFARWCGSATSCATSSRAAVGAS